MGKALDAFWPGRPASWLRGWAGTTPRRCRFVSMSRLRLWISESEKTMLLRISEETGATCGAVNFGVFTRVLREWWMGEKYKRASDAAGASSGGGQKRRFDHRPRVLHHVRPIYHEPNLPNFKRVAYTGRADNCFRVVSPWNPLGYSLAKNIAEPKCGMSSIETADETTYVSSQNFH